MPFIAVPKEIVKLASSKKIYNVVSAFTEALYEGPARIFLEAFIEKPVNHIKGAKNQQQLFISNDLREYGWNADKTARVVVSGDYMLNRTEELRLEIVGWLNELAGREIGIGEKRPCNQATFVAAAFMWAAQQKQQEQETKALPIAFLQPKGNPLALQPIATQYDEAYDPYTLFIAA